MMEAKFLTTREGSNKYGKKKDWEVPEVLDWIRGINVNIRFLLKRKNTYMCIYAYFINYIMYILY